MLEIKREVGFDNSKNGMLYSPFCNNLTDRKTYNQENFK